MVLVQPEVKNFVNGTTPAAKSPEAKAAAPKAKKAQEEASAPGSGFEAFRPLVLPLSLLFVGGAGVAAVKADPKFGTLLDESWGSRDSNVMGVGYETAPGLKDTPFYGVTNSTGAKAAAPKVGGAAREGAKNRAAEPGRPRRRSELCCASAHAGNGWRLRPRASSLIQLQHGMPALCGHSLCGACALHDRSFYAVPAAVQKTGTVKKAASNGTAKKAASNGTAKKSVLSSVFGSRD